MRSRSYLFWLNTVVIIAATLLVRLIYPGVFIFKEDEARALFFALDVAREHTLLTHTWPSSIGIANSPLFVYLLVPAVLIATSPPFVSLVMNLAGLLSVAVVYLIFKRIFQERHEVLLAVLFYAIAPMAVHYSRKIWDPVPLPLIAALAFYTAQRVLAHERSRAVFPLVLLLAIAAQIHQSGIFFALLVAGVVALHRPRIAYRWLLMGFVTAVACAAPYLRYLAGPGLGEFAARQRSVLTALPDIDVVTNLILNATGHNLFATAGRDAVAFLNWPIPGFGALVGVLMLLFLPVLCFGVVELWSRSSLRFSCRPPFVTTGAAAQYNLLLIVILGLPFLYLLFRVPGVAHYYLVTFPFTFSLIALGITRIERTRPAGWLRRSLFLLPLLWCVLILCFLSMTSFRNGGYSYGPHYGFMREIARGLMGEVKRADRPGAGNPAGGEQIRGGTDTVAVAINAPRTGSPLPPQWEYLLRDEYRCVPVPPGSGPYYRVTIEWKPGLWRRGEYRIERIDPAGSR